MGKNNKKNNEGEQNNEENKKTNITVVLKVDLHCDGCTGKVMKCLRSFDGVDAVRIGDGEKVTVVGAVDPVKLRDKLVKKTRKSVELISPQPQKGNNENNNGENGQKEKNNEKKPPKEKEIPVTTAVFKLNLHCDGCIQRMYKTISKTRGYSDMRIDKQKDLVTVTGAIEMKGLAEALSKKLKKNVEIVNPKKDGEKGQNGGGGEEKAGGNNNQKQAQAVVGCHPYPFMSGPVYIGDQIHYNAYPAYQTPKMFSDENPNACSLM